MVVKSLFDETALLQKTAAGDQRAFRTLYEYYYRKVFTQATRLTRSRDSGEEITQEVFLKLWRLGSGLSDIKNLDHYLKVTTRNQSISAIRRMALETKGSREFSRNYIDGHNETEEGIVLNDTRKVLHEAIDRLPKQQREVYLLCHQEGLKYEEAAERLNLSPLTVQTHMKRALKSLRGYLRNHTEVAAILIILKLL